MNIRKTLSLIVERLSKGTFLLTLTQNNNKKKKSHRPTIYIWSKHMENITDHQRKYVIPTAMKVRITCYVALYDLFQISIEEYRHPETENKQY